MSGLKVKKWPRNGWSKQAPSGMVALTVVEYSNYMREALAQIKR